MQSIRKRWYFWLIVLVALPVLFFGIGLIYSGQGRINQANFDRIHEGMTQEQVTAILGEPDLPIELLTSVTLTWMAGPDVISVTLTDDKVTAKAYNPPTVWRRVRWLLGDRLEKIGINDVEQ